jgi:hypothetical protein
VANPRRGTGSPDARRGQFPATRPRPSPGNALAGFLLARELESRYAPPYEPQPTTPNRREERDRGRRRFALIRDAIVALGAALGIVGMGELIAGLVRAFAAP